MTNILFITTSHDELSNTHRKTGVWLEEIAGPYYIMKEAGIALTIASPRGGSVRLDPKSESIAVATPFTKRFLKDPEAMNFLANSIVIENINSDHFDAIFLPGGHGCLWDLPANNTLKELLKSFDAQNKPIAAIAQGVAGLLSLQNDQGEFLLKNKQVTSTTNTEEASTGMFGIVPFLMETELLSLGAFYTKATDYMSHVVSDGNIITGQNSSSSIDVAKKMLAQMKDKEEALKLEVVNVTIF